ncbi:hypothetical protein MTR67_024748 [Solanum verrucosum]|uniref:Uncharacterized protein n=1 Tax=Solanum verrucosum TaxID=315347 RepID=A0AAF0QY28_SOLVR|nr:hypothetical protein MTR67_024748 [Solanum verrucosum]
MSFPNITGNTPKSS